MFPDMPFLVLKRTLIIRVLLLLFVLPITAFLGWGMIANMSGPQADTMTAALFGVAFLVLGSLLVFAFLREMTRVTHLSESGVGQRSYFGEASLRWDDVTEIWFQAVKVQAGGLAGMALSAALDATLNRSENALDARTSNITIKLLGRNGEKITLTSSDKGVLQAFEAICARVNPRLLRDLSQRVARGESVAFGKVSLSKAGVGVGRKAPIPFQELERFAVEAGYLSIKKTGQWFATKVALKEIPNAFVLTQLHAQLSATPDGAGDLKLNRNLTQRTFM